MLCLQLGGDGIGTANRGESLRMVINDQADLLGAVAVAKESWNSQLEEVTCNGNDWLLAGSAGQEE